MCHYDMMVEIGARLDGGIILLVNLISIEKYTMDFKDCLSFSVLIINIFGNTYTPILTIILFK